MSRGPVCKRWRNFRNFFYDVGQRPSWRHLLVRCDPSGEFSPTNARWQIGKSYRHRRLPPQRGVAHAMDRPTASDAATRRSAATAAPQAVLEGITYHSRR
jgi:hypothetical protein